MSTAVLTSASNLSTQGLSTLDALLGSTETSRAVASVIELIRDEFKKPEAGKDNASVGYMDLFGGTVGFVLLQRWARRKTEREFRARGGEEIIWDAVIDDKGFRADVVGTQKTTYRERPTGQTDEPLHSGRPISFVSPAGDEAIEAIERGTIPDLPDLPVEDVQEESSSDEHIRRHITAQLPRGCRAVIASETVTSKTIRVDLYDSAPTELTPPPGTVMITEHCRGIEDAKHKSELHLPAQSVSFRSMARRSSSSDVTGTGDSPLKSFPIKSPATVHAHHAEPLDETDEGVTMHSSANGDNSIASARRRQLSCGSSDNVIPVAPIESHALDRDVKSSAAPVSIADSPTSAPTANQKKPRRPPPPLSCDLETEKDPNSSTSMVGTGSEPCSLQNKKSNKLRHFRKVLEQLNPTTSTARFDNMTFADSTPNPPGASESGGFGSTFQHQKELPPVPRSNPSPEIRHDQNSPHLSLPPNDARSTRRSTPSSRSNATMPNPTHHATWDRGSEPMTHETIETYSTHSLLSRPESPTITRTHSRKLSNLSKTRSDRDVSMWSPSHNRSVSGGAGERQRSRSFVSSLYSMATKNSDTSLILAPRVSLPLPGMFDDQEVLQALGTQGKVPGIFPDDHLVRNVRRYARFSSASYGSQFLRFMGLVADKASDETADMPKQKTSIHHEHSSFSQHTGLPPDTILLSSFEDPHGGLGFYQSASTALPLTHFISVDGDAKAVVLTCRGTLGFEDVLTDMLCDYDDIDWRGSSYQVHKGIHASARRMLDGQGSRVMATLKTALEKYPDYGLILTGHSLGGAVASLLAILIAEPRAPEESGAPFITTNPQKSLLPPQSSGNQGTVDLGGPTIALPAGRRVHVYTYGPPAIVSPALRMATRGLITTIVHSNDIVPSLSLGVLHDFRSVASSLKHDTTGAIAALKSRVWERVRHAAQSAFYIDGGDPPLVQSRAGDGLGEDSWAWSALENLRQGMTNTKLVPPGEVFVVETSRVFDRQDGVMAAVATAAAATTRTTTTTTTTTTNATDGNHNVSDAATDRVFNSLGRPATRVQMKLVRDVETRFGELRFGSRMFSDHSPARYEASLATLEAGVLDE